MLDNGERLGEEGGVHLAEGVGEFESRRPEDCES